MRGTIKGDGVIKSFQRKESVFEIFHVGAVGKKDKAYLPWSLDGIVVLNV